MPPSTLSHNDYTVGWICALPKEQTAATAMLDQRHDDLPSPSHDSNTYTLGSIGKHNIVIACLPKNQYGTNAAANVVTLLAGTFPSVRSCLMVGIGGGIPSNKVRLGDVVVGTPENQFPGVVQWDMGRAKQGGEFERTGALNNPPKALLTALAKLQTENDLSGSKIPLYLDELKERYPKAAERYLRSDSLVDICFKSSYDHVSLDKSGRNSTKENGDDDEVEDEDDEEEDNCRFCDKSQSVKRKPRDMRVHYGLIASGNQVIKDAKSRDKLNRNLGGNVLCVEMEAAGIVNNCPCLVIRGICDYADSHKNMAWQEHAAAVAAAYAKELLLIVPPNEVQRDSLIKDVLNEVSDFSKKLDAINEAHDRAFEQRASHHRQQITRVITEDQRDCLQAFKTSTYELHKDINPDRAPGTCKWVLESPEYRHWWESTGNDLLWISADPGCGKSVLAKSLVDDVFMVSAQTVSICYFFFKDSDEQNSLALALCSVLHQLFTSQPQLLRHALPFWEKNNVKIQQETEDLWRILIAATSDPASTNTVCVFDALDECRRHDQKRLIEKLRTYHDNARSYSQKNWLKFLVTSRPYDEIWEDFQPLIQSFPQIHLRGEEENDQIHSEISLVVKIRVAELCKKLKLKTKTQERLEKQLLQMEHRTYLWLYLAIDDIHTTFRNSLRPDQEPVQLIPKSVNEAYKKILNRVHPQQEPVVRTILQIIVGAQRPLTIQEMAMALGVATSPNARTAEEAGVNPDILSGKIRHLCGLFVFIKDSRIYLIHQTAREFLLKRSSRPTNHKWYFEPGDTEVRMTQICVRYLLMDDLEVKGRDAGIHNLLEYSAQNWPDHFQEVSSTTPELVTCVYHLYNSTTKRFTLWFPIFWKAAMPYSKIPQMNALHIAAFNGHDEVVYKLVMDGKIVINDPDSIGVTALQWASLRGHYQTVQILLDSGADVNAQGGEYGNALQAASAEGHVEIVQQLLEKEADINAQDEMYGNALQAASAEGHVEIVQQLLEKGADINVQGGLYGNALQAASVDGHVEIVQKLLAKGADINAQGGEYGNALQAASAGGHVEIVQLLLDNGADVNAQGGYYGNALQAASYKGHVEIVQQLLAKGADINVQGGLYGNALQAASVDGHVEIVQQLLENGADINAQGGEYGNALLAASAKGHQEIVKLLQRMVGIISSSKRLRSRTLSSPAKRFRLIDTNPPDQLQ